MNCPEVQQEISIALLTHGEVDADTAAHIARCPECAAEQARLHPMPALMSTVSRADLQPLAELPDDLLLRRIIAAAQTESQAAARRRHTGRLGLVGAAVLLVLFAITGVFAFIRLAADAQTVQASASANGINAIARIRPADSGSDVTLWVAGVPDDMHCVVTLTSDGHAPQVIADWTAEYESSVTFTAVIAAAPAEVTRIRLRAADGRTLLDLPITA
ncbi:MAG: hypothetical protein PHU75_09635 [Candidatus Nanopelagicales bacterium]|nr:hypothetical protein [Candidatus Nanopelagicales bacterium]